MTFLFPAVLLGLAALPALYFLLRLIPPPARRIAFPPLSLLRDLAAEARTPHRMPLWLLLLRIGAATLLIIGLAGPSLHPVPSLPGKGPVLLVIDNGWASAPDWTLRRDTALRLIAAARQSGREMRDDPAIR
jgi:predicted lysophospholipase L1 biosynthesis ABC-type transport system permease subunit